MFLLYESNLEKKSIYDLYTFNDMEIHKSTLSGRQTFVSKRSDVFLTTYPIRKSKKDDFISSFMTYHILYIGRSISSLKQSKLGYFFW